jgi:hypothetical protein
MKLPTKKPSPEKMPLFERVNKDFKAVLDKYKHELDAVDILAVAAHLVGTIIALQDQRTMTPEMALELAAMNIEAGNAEALEEVMKSNGSA